MTILFSGQSGNLTAAGTWRVVDATTYLNSEAGQTALTTSFVSSPAFTPGAITIEGIAVKVASRLSTPSGTFSIRLAQAGVAVAGTTVTINAADLPQVDSAGGHWVYMKFAAPVTLLAATAYTLQALNSVANNVNLYRDATANNYSRALLTTTTAAPAAGDTFLMSGQHTAAGTNALYTITMDNTAATVWGTLANLAAEVGAKAKFAFGNAASTAYQFICAGAINVGGGGQFFLDDTSAPLPASSSILLQFNVASAGQFGLNLRYNHVFKTGGAAKVGRAILGANAAVSATAITTSTSTGWIANDNIVIVPTTSAGAAFDLRVLNGNAAGATVNLTAGLTNAKTIHAGTEVEVLNLTRNIRIVGSSTTNTALISYAAMSTIEISNTEFRNVGIINSPTVAGAGSSLIVSGSSFWDIPNLTFFNASTHAFVSFTDCVGHNASAFTTFSNCGSNPANCIFEDLWFNRGTSATNGWIFASGNNCYTVNRVRCIGGGNTAFTVGNNSTHNTGAMIVTNCVFKCSSVGFRLNIAYTELSTHNISNNKSYLNTGSGVTMSGAGWTLGSFECFSNATTNVSLTGNSKGSIANFNCYAGPTTPSPIGITFSALTPLIYIDNCTFGVGGTHSTGDVRFNNTGNAAIEVAFRNCLFNSATEFSNQTNMALGSKVTSSRHDQIDGNHKIITRYGTVSSDSVIARSAAYAQRLTPLSASYKIESEIKKVPVEDNRTQTIGVWVRKSVVGDGQAYNGNQPRLVLKADPSVYAGVTDIVLATAAAAAGAWEYLTGTTPAAIDNAAFKPFIDCDGTSGWIDVDDWKQSKTHATNKEKYWSDGGPCEFIIANQGGGFIS